MGRVLGQLPTVLTNGKNVLTVEETTSAGRCGSSFAFFSCPTSTCHCDSEARGIFSIFEEELGDR